MTTKLAPVERSRVRTRFELLRKTVIVCCNGRYC
jgi:hypothetical protein